MKDFHSPGNAKKNPNKIKITLTYGTVEEMDDMKPRCFQGGALPGGALPRGSSKRVKWVWGREGGREDPLETPAPQPQEHPGRWELGQQEVVKIEA